MSKWMSKAVDRRSLLVGMAGLAASGDALAANFKPDWQRRNMASFAAPSVDRVRMAIIGCGKRAKTLVKSLTDVDGVAIVSVCDLRAEEAEATAALVSEKGLPVPKTIHGDEIAYRQAFDDEIDVVYICTPWEWHAPMAIDAMNAGAHAAVEVPLATTADELWAMIRTSETTGKHCFLLENACYVREEMALRRMTQAGVLGDVVHTEGSYIHDSRHLYANYGYFPDLWFVSNSLTRNGNLYQPMASARLHWS